MEANINMIGSLQAQVASLQSRLAKKNEEITAMAKTSLFSDSDGSEGKERKKEEEEEQRKLNDSFGSGGAITKGAELRMKQIEQDLLSLREQNDQLMNTKEKIEIEHNQLKKQHAKCGATANVHTT
jgi:hypothetical protein